jgi:hypothetical protein
MDTMDNKSVTFVICTMYIIISAHELAKRVSYVKS